MKLLFLMGLFFLLPFEVDLVAKQGLVLGLAPFAAIIHGCWPQICIG
jgi:hypothetical protein